MNRIIFSAAQLCSRYCWYQILVLCHPIISLPWGIQPSCKLQLNKSPLLAAIWNWSAPQLLPCACSAFIPPSPPPPSRECYCVNQGSQQALLPPHPHPPSSKCASSLRLNWKQFSVQLFLIFGWTHWVLCESSLSLSQEINCFVYQRRCLKSLTGWTWTGWERLNRIHLFCDVHPLQELCRTAEERESVAWWKHSHVKSIKTNQKASGCFLCPPSLLSLSSPPLKPLPDRLFL